jgi:hypothetical protein
MAPRGATERGPEGRHTMQQDSIPRAPFPTGICEIGSCGSSELWNLRDCNLSPGGCHRQHFVRNSAAFLRGRVRHRRCDRGRKRVRLRRGPGGGAKCPPACARGVQDRGGAHSPFLILACRREGVPGVVGGLGWAHPRSAITLSPARAFPVPRIMVWRNRPRRARAARGAVRQRCDVHHDTDETFTSVNLTTRYSPGFDSGGLPPETCSSSSAVSSFAWFASSCTRLLVVMMFTVGRN